MKLERLESIPDEVDAKLFHTLRTLRPDITDLELQRWTAAIFRELATEVELRNAVEFVWRDDNDKLHLSAFGVLNGFFMRFCPGFRLMVTEGPNEPRRLWVCKETE
jgi:hypothetical protein